MRKFKYSTHPQGISYDCEAISVKEYHTIIIKNTVLASSEEEGAGFFTEWLENNLEGFDWDITIKESDKQRDK